jgi:hypothetical protein
MSRREAENQLTTASASVEPLAVNHAGSLCDAARCASQGWHLNWQAMPFSGVLTTVYDLWLSYEIGGVQPSSQAMQYFKSKET